VALDPDKTCKNIGRRIAELRQARGWTQEAFAVRLRATFQWISQVEGGRNLTIHSLVKIANALGADLRELLEPPHPSTRRRGPGRPKKLL
jgi:transcriptional regulator with XRE-family HTH domain